MSMSQENCKNDDPSKNKDHPNTSFRCIIITQISVKNKPTDVVFICKYQFKSQTTVLTSVMWAAVR